MKVLAVGNEKGGTGKSAIATQMAFYAAEEGARVLLVDLDPQATCTFNFVDAVPDDALTSLHLFGITMPASRNPCKTHAAPIDLVPATRLLDAVPERAAAHLREFKGYDIIIIDTPPTRGKLFRAALRAADAIVTPFEPKAESLRGIAGLIDTIGAVRQEHNPRLRHLGIVANRVPVDNIGAARLLAQLGEQVGTLLLPEFMYERAAINAALAVRRPVWRTLRGEAHSLAAEEVHRVMRAILERLQ